MRKGKGVQTPGVRMTEALCHLTHRWGDLASIWQRPLIPAWAFAPCIRIATPLPFQAKPPNNFRPATGIMMPRSPVIATELALMLIDD